MKLKNCVVGTKVQIKNIDESPLFGEETSSRDYGVIEDNYGVIAAEPDNDGDVKVLFEESCKSTLSHAVPYLYVHHTKLRHYCFK